MSRKNKFFLILFVAYIPCMAWALNYETENGYQLCANIIERLGVSRTDYDEAGDEFWVRVSADDGFTGTMRVGPHIYLDKSVSRFCKKAVLWPHIGGDILQFFQIVLFVVSGVAVFIFFAILLMVFVGWICEEEK